MQFSVDEIHNLTKIDKWFLYKLQNIHNKKRCLEIMPFEMRFHESNIKNVLESKKLGFSDQMIAKCWNCCQSDIYEL